MFETTKSKTVVKIFHETAKTKGQWYITKRILTVFVLSTKRSLYPPFFVEPLACLFIVVTPALYECLDFGHLPAVIGVLCVCVFVC